MRPSHSAVAEKVLWRISSLAIIIGLFNSISHILAPKLLELLTWHTHRIFSTTDDPVTIFVSVVAVVIYIIERVTLIVLALIHCSVHYRRWLFALWIEQRSYLIYKEYSLSTYLATTISVYIHKNSL